MAVWGGSLWVATKETDAKPDAPDSGWMIAARKGRDGKSAKD
jgi:integrin beta 3